ncbi:hypothetical protein BDP55DRAFT_685684 [Colletotrichum godetiae]|uniref:Uncharacterized protein n=1 Tax=Colletotrichum godetiae TaxID=1209918 RepID=A0AAJ0A6L0_9PEZI|nr:uncharacterized protein BDP55DRAFT_685684 [Colletotrichum godetiae]KAK1657471.1 hypothetical protein BDP55DRAFT_685684 [Colletotrichum godetiae]
MEEDKDHAVFCMLTRTLYTLESHVSIAFGRPSLLVVGDDLRRELVQRTTSTQAEQISISSYLISLLKLQIHNTILQHHNKPTTTTTTLALSHETTPTLRSTCETYRQTLDSWSATWQQSTTSSSPTTSPASKDALLAWGSLHHHHALSLITTLWPTPGGNALTICGGVSQAALQLLRHQQVFANLAYEEAKVGAPLPAEEEVLIFPFDWTMSHLVFQAGLRAMGEKDTTLLPTSEKNPAQCPPLQQCFSMLLLLEADASKLLRGQSLVFEALSEKINM